MKNKKRGFFLLDAVLATLIVSILLSAVLLSLQISVKGFRKINQNLFTLYLAEKILWYKFLLWDKFVDIGSEDTAYGKFSWQIKEEKLNGLRGFSVYLSKEGKIYSKISSFILK